MLSFLRSLVRPFRRLRPLATSEDATHAFLDLFQGHGLPCKLRDGWIVADSGCLKAQARIYPNPPGPKSITVELELETRTPTGKAIFEVCVGSGATQNDAIADSIRNFSLGSFHVIYSALTGQPCSHCDIEEWEIAGKLRRVFISPAVTRGDLGKIRPAPQEWFAEITKHIRQSQIPDGMHWFRFFHSDWPGGEPINEALFDNEIAPELEQQLMLYPWQPADQFYTVRVFMIIMDADE